ncbi:hypothetical protein [Enterobacter ludwigii]|uniref:bestrophin-like domain n=1 Tax=Enterobacter ludwigii TaxID=299767 RepID=UPI00103E951F|nr:hypothetical protein [Enterobacter ludwigii]
MYQKTNDTRKPQGGYPVRNRMTEYFLMMPAADDVLLLAVTGALLTMSAYIGRWMHHPRKARTADGGAVIAVGGLVMSVLLTGMALSVAINGYTARKQSQTREALAAERVWQYTSLLPDDMSHRAQGVLRGYMDERIHFFLDDSVQGGRSWSQLAQGSQQQLWGLVSPAVAHNPDAVMADLLAAVSELRASQQQTGAVWRRHIPDAAWLVLAGFSMASCCLSGRQLSGQRRPGIYLLALPGLMSLALFLTAEIDIPGQGIIRVTPEDIEQVMVTLPPQATGVTHDASRSVYHVP